MSRRRPPRDELAIERARAGLRAAVAALPPERRAVLAGTLERAAEREEKEAMPKKGPTGKRADAGTEPITVRLDSAMLAAVEKATEQIQAERPDSTLSRGDAIRVLLAEALTARKIVIR
jgi:hypothetical protein